MGLRQPKQCIDTGQTPVLTSHTFNRRVWNINASTAFWSSVLQLKWCNKSTYCGIMYSWESCLADLGLQYPFLELDDGCQAREIAREKGRNVGLWLTLDLLMFFCIFKHLPIVIKSQKRMLFFNYVVYFVWGKGAVGGSRNSWNVFSIFTNYLDIKQCDLENGARTLIFLHPLFRRDIKHRLSKFIIFTLFGATCYMR